MTYGIALDVGTSGFRAHAIDLESGRIKSTAITNRHPLPGANVMDHLDFALNAGGDMAHRIVIDTVNRLIARLGIDLQKVERLAVCGNPIQLSLFQNSEFRDLAFAGKKAKKRLGVENIERPAHVTSPSSIDLEINPQADVLVPPCVKHEIGADALAMMYKTDMLFKDETSIVIDYGTNAEMSLKYKGSIYSGSAAAGPAIEGQHIRFGMLAAPGAISDIEERDGELFLKMLDENMYPIDVAVLDPRDLSVAKPLEQFDKVKGITGTGVIAIMSVGIDLGLMNTKKILLDGGRVVMGDLFFDDHDLGEAGKAIGAMRAGYRTLVEEVGISLEEVETAYMTGASGTYVDAIKAQRLGLVAPVANIIQAGNTSLAMAADIVRDPSLLDKLQTIADQMASEHIMFADSQVFKNAYVMELSYWNEGMPYDMFNSMSSVYKLRPLPPLGLVPKVNRLVMRDIPDLGDDGLSIFRNVGMILKGVYPDCLNCHSCIDACMEDAIRVEEMDEGAVVLVDTALCDGMACLRCEDECPEYMIRLTDMKLVPKT